MSWVIALESEPLGSYDHREKRNLIMTGNCGVVVGCSRERRTCYNNLFNNIVLDNVGGAISQYSQSELG